jgi:hypothetical protein
MDEVRIARRSPRRARERDEERGHEQDEPRPPPQVAHDPVPERDPEVRERRGGHDLDLHALASHRLDRVAHEEAGDVTAVPRVGRRQDDDLHARRLAKTIGAASASIANAKK